MQASSAETPSPKKIIETGVSMDIIEILESDDDEKIMETSGPRDIIELLESDDDEAGAFH